MRKTLYSLIVAGSAAVGALAGCESAPQPAPLPPQPYITKHTGAQDIEAQLMQTSTPEIQSLKYIKIPGDMSTLQKYVSNYIPDTKTGQRHSGAKVDRKLLILSTLVPYDQCTEEISVDEATRTVNSDVQIPENEHFILAQVYRQKKDSPLEQLTDPSRSSEEVEIPLTEVPVKESELRSGASYASTISPTNRDYEEVTLKTQDSSGNPVDMQCYRVNSINTSLSTPTSPALNIIFFPKEQAKIIRKITRGPDGTKVITAIKGKAYVPFKGIVTNP